MADVDFFVRLPERAGCRRVRTLPVDRHAAESKTTPPNSSAEIGNRGRRVFVSKKRMEGARKERRVKWEA